MSNQGPNYDGLILFGIKVPKDKILHFIVGFFLSSIIYTLTKGNIISSLSIALAAGIAKELYDHFNPKNQVDIWDAIATFAGGAALVVLVESLKFIR
jgi:Na+/H+-dicarboxylate symporter